MATINEIFGIGMSGLSANKALAAIASQNIANASTPGYVRQTLVLSTRFLGLPGVDVEGPRAIRNPFLARQLVETLGRLGYHEGQQAALVRVESAINDLDGTGLGPQLTRFQAALAALAANPNSDVERDGVLATPSNSWRPLAARASSWWTGPTRRTTKRLAPPIRSTRWPRKSPH